MGDPVAQQRAAFEAFASRAGWTDFEMQRDVHGYYLVGELRGMWCGWLACVRHLESVNKEKQS